ncbi:hypothetical protein D3C78_881200 [compost metagenome]
MKIVFPKAVIIFACLNAFTKLSKKKKLSGREIVDEVWNSSFVLNALTIIIYGGNKITNPAISRDKYLNASPILFERFISSVPLSVQQVALNR